MLDLISRFLSFIVKLRNWLFDREFIPVVKSNRPVVSIGNLSFGGTGKTPFTIYLAKILSEKNIKPLILSRGYKRKSKSFMLIDENSTLSPKIVGDEIYLIRQNLNIPIAISRKKFKAIKHLNEIHNYDIILIDDGFQHRRLHKDLDIVLVDKATLEKPFVFPKGVLREPIESLKRADFILLEEGCSEESLAKHKNKIFIYKKTIKEFRDIHGKSFEIKSIQNEKVALLSAIGNNENFRKSLDKYFSNNLFHFQFRDHHYYSKNDIKKIIKKMKFYQVKYLITTEKDFYKISQFQDLFEEGEIKVITSILNLKVNEIDKIIEKIEQMVTYTNPK